MRVTFKTRLYIGFSLAIILCAASGLTSYFLLDKQETQRIWVRKARRMLDTTTRVQGLVIDMETGRRGFRATNQQRFLEPYKVALIQVKPTLAELKKLCADDTELAAEEATLEDHIFRLMAFWQQNGDNASAYTRDYITKLTDDEKRRMDEIRTIAKALQADETKLLTKRREEHDRLVHYGTLSSSIDSILSEIIIVILIIIISREFRSRRKAQMQLKDTIEELQRQTAVLQASETELKDTTDELGKINKQLEKFVYTVAHDVKSPLSGIIGTLSLLQADEMVMANPELTEIANLSSSAALHLTAMVNSLLEYSKISLAEQHSEIVDTKEMLKQLAVLLFPPKNIQIIIADEMPVFSTRKLKIQQVFQNLISNAIKYNGKEKGVIEIGYIDAGEYYRFYVIDNGMGISEDDRESVFGLMKTTGNISTANSSTGFGLNIVKLIVEEQGGKIWYDSAPDHGTTFYFEWKK
jgi:signal transduction histidine kinase